MLVEPVPACHCPPERVAPGKKPFDFPAATITPQGATILRCLAFSIAPMWRHHPNPLGSRGVIGRITVMGTIPNNSSGLSHRDNFIEGSPDRGDLMRAGRIRVQGERKTGSVCNGHESRTLAPPGLSHFCAPFFATTNVPSMKHSERLMAPRSSGSRASASGMFRNTPVLPHLPNRRSRLMRTGISPASQPRRHQCAIATRCRSVQGGHHEQDAFPARRKPHLQGEVPELPIVHLLIPGICS